MCNQAVSNLHILQKCWELNHTIQILDIMVHLSYLKWIPFKSFYSKNCILHVNIWNSFEGINHLVLNEKQNYKCRQTSKVNATIRIKIKVSSNLQPCTTKTYAAHISVLATYNIFAILISHIRIIFTIPYWQNKLVGFNA